MSDERISASRVIPAPADRVLAVLRDPDGHVAIDSSGMLQSAEGERVEQTVACQQMVGVCPWDPPSVDTRLSVHRTASGRG